MKIIYKQPNECNNNSLMRCNIHNCYLKKLSMDVDHENITKKKHHHTCFELHIVTHGYQEYEISGTHYRLEKGTFLLIYPNTPHTVISSSSPTQKYSVMFDKQADEQQNCFYGTLTERIADNFEFISKEILLKKENSITLIENNILEILVSVFRLSKIKENDMPHTIIQDGNAIVYLSKKYIEDNIEQNPVVSDVSKHSHLSTKQLTRIFRKFEGCSLREYIIIRRIEKIKELLLNDSLSLKEISETMNFNNEYYFNTFFKKHSGLPPGEYRKMLGK